LARDDHGSEIRRLRESLAVLRSEAEANEAILRRSQARELFLLRAADLRELLDALVAGLRAAFELDAVTVCLSDPQHEIRHLLMADGIDTDGLKGVRFQEALESVAPQFTSLYRSWLGPCIGADHGLLFPSASDVKSCALIPLRRQDQLVGVLNFGSRDPNRFTRHHATDFLDHLGNVAAVCLENAVNRARLVRSGLTDVLTGWHNRRYLQTRIREEVARAQRAGKCLACVFLDVDHFKRVNDNWGHPAGDRVLREMAERVELMIRSSDVAARYGGEEFAILLPATDASAAGVLAERIRAEVSRQPVFLADGTPVPLTVSLGVAAFDGQREGGDLKAIAEELIARADVQLYRAKRGGRDRVCIEGGDG
jgi:diguanylate cyclase (GGDEF)-like protein